MCRGLGPAQDVSSLNLAALLGEPPFLRWYASDVLLSRRRDCVQGQGCRMSARSGLGSSLRIAVRDRGVLGHALGTLALLGTVRRVRAFKTTGVDRAGLGFGLTGRGWAGAKARAC